MTDMTEVSRARCRRPAPPETSGAFLLWESLGDGSEVIRPSAPRSPIAGS